MRFALFVLVALFATPVAISGQSFTFTIDPLVIHYDPATGIGSGSTQVLLSQDLNPGELADPVPGFAFSFSQDPSLLNTVDISSAPLLQMLNGGVGPGLGVQEPYPDGGVVSAVFNLLGQEMLFFETPQPVIELSFATNPATWIGDLDGGTATFSDQDPAGVIPGIEDVVVIGANSFPVTWVFPVVQFVPIGQFIRGDADGDGSVIVIGDAITVLGGLFSGETIPCLAAADVNGDGAVDVADPITLLNFGLLGGAPPPAPFPDCGSDPEPSTLDCANTAC